MTQADLPEDDRRDDRPSDDRDLPPETTSDDRTMGMLCHLLGAFTGFLGPLIIWLIKKDQSRFVDDQGKEALNFQITMLIGHVIGAATACFTFGLVSVAVVIIGLVFSILGALEANKGVRYRYPINIRMIT
jgi:uncharacterized Tic20 family protein